MDLGPKLVIAGFALAIRQSGLGRCDIEDAGAIDSLKRPVRYQFNRSWKPPTNLPIYSIVGVVTPDETSNVLQIMRRRLAFYSQDQDSQVIAEEGIVPGARFLGVARGDHWALALPLAEANGKKLRVDHNLFPRVALVEAIVRFAMQSG
jgi:hypothetical protein